MTNNIEQVVEYCLSEDLKTTLNKISRGRGLSPASTFAANITKIGATNNCDLEIIKIDSRSVSIRLNGKRKKVEILTEPDFNIASESRLIPPSRWFSDVNAKLKLQNKLKSNVLKAKEKVAISNGSLNRSDFI